VEVNSAPNETAFSARRRSDWNDLDDIVRAAELRNGLKRLGAERIARLPPLYRNACADLAYARVARYSAELVDYLQGLVAGAHTIMYGRSAGDPSTVFGTRRAGTPRTRASWLRLALELFPRAVRRHKTAMLVAFLLFFVPLLGAVAMSLGDPAFAARVVPEEQLKALTEAYRQGFASGRGAGTDAAMAGFYVDNNVGIALRCFATGVAFGLGSAFYLVENGLATGAMLGYVAAHGAGANIVTFVVGHSSLELGAIVLAGGAGLALGWSVVAPGSRTRVASLQATARSVVVVVLGAAVMLLLAAAIEGFWSASSAAVTVKRTVGAAMFVAVCAYLVLAGRGSTEAEAAERGWRAR
jgi:uncharacterized membrane protein SpoIIM required for sporulation